MVYYSCFVNLFRFLRYHEGKKPSNVLQGHWEEVRILEVSRQKYVQCNYCCKALLLRLLDRKLLINNDGGV